MDGFPPVGSVWSGNVQGVGKHDLLVGEAQEVMLAFAGFSAKFSSRACMWDVNPLVFTRDGERPVPCRLF